MYVETDKHPEVKKILDLVGAANTKQVRIIYVDVLDLLGHDWSEGSYSQYHIIRLSDCAILDCPIRPMEIGQFETAFVNDFSLREFVMRDGFIVVHRNCYRGKWYFTIYAPKGVKLIEDDNKKEYSWLDKAVLYATRAFKSSYGGIKDYRAYELMNRYNIKLADIKAVRERLKEQGLIDSRGAITVAGKNVVEGIYSWPEEE